MSIHRPGDEVLLRGELLERLRGAGRRGRDPEALARELAGRWAPEAVARELDALERAGALVSWNGRLLARELTDWRVGSLQVLSGGDGLVRLPGEREPAFFIQRRGLAGARDGDTVLVKPHRRRHRRRPSDLPRASLTRVLDRGHPRAVGTVEPDGERRWLLPFDPKLNLEVEVVGAGELDPDTFVVVDTGKLGARAQRPARGRVVEVLGRVDTPGVDVEVMLRHLEIPDAFPPAVLAAAEELPSDPEPAEWRGRRDLRGLTTVTIDGGSARDFDDAISVERRADGGVRAGVHIADVSYYVGEGSPLDLEAYRRGTSVYFPDRAVPMLPERLSNGLCSLRPGVPRLTLSVFLDVNAAGEVMRHRFARSVIRSARRLTYEEVRRVLEEPTGGDEGEYGRPILELLTAARDLMRLLHRARLERGSIDFDLPHGDVILDTDGYTVDVKPGERNTAHRIIEELMIGANEAVAAELERRGVPALYRVHQAPGRESLDELGQVLESLGIRLAGDPEDPGPSVLQGVLRQVEGRREEPFVASLVLRSMQRALYDPEPRGHYALATRHYTHFTSPIRRYPDLLVHRQLEAAVLGGDPEAAARTLLAERLPAIAASCSRTERRAERAEREILQWKLVRLLADRVGERFRGRITGVQPFGVFVQLLDYFVDGLVPIRELDDDDYELDNVHHVLSGRRRGRQLRLADEVEVELTGVDARRRGLNLRLAPD